MICDVTEPVLDYEENEAKGPDGDPVRIRNLIFQALNTTRQGEQLSPAESLKSGMISHAVMRRGKVKLSSSDVAFILARSGLVNPPLAHYRLTCALDPDALPSDEYGNLDSDGPEDAPGD